MTLSDRTSRTERLIASRRKAASDKQATALAAIQTIQSRGHRVTFAEVAKTGCVSTWFAYNNPVVRSAVETALREQQDQRMQAAPNIDDRTAYGLRSELAEARAEIRDLREERKRLRVRLQRQLGDYVDSHSQGELLARLQTLEQENRELHAALHETSGGLESAKQDLDRLQNELDGSRLALRQMMRQQQHSRPQNAETFKLT